MPVGCRYGQRDAARAFPLAQTQQHLNGLGAAIATQGFDRHRCAVMLALQTSDQCFFEHGLREFIKTV